MTIGTVLVRGNPVLTVDGKLKLVLHSGLCMKWREVTSTNNLAIFETQRKEQAPSVARFSLSDAERAGMLSRPGWKDPKAMLRRHAMLTLLDDVYSDVFANVTLAGRGAR